MVLIHYRDGYVSLDIDNQGDLALKMPNGLWFEPPCPDSTRWEFYEDGIRWAWLYQYGVYKGIPGYGLINAPYPLAMVPRFQVPDSFHNPLGDLEHGTQPEMCLCPVDLELTGNENGYDVDRIDEKIGRASCRERV